MILVGGQNKIILCVNFVEFNVNWPVIDSGRYTKSLQRDSKDPTTKAVGKRICKGNGSMTDCVFTKDKVQLHSIKNIKYVSSFNSAGQAR